MDVCVCVDIREMEERVSDIAECETLLKLTVTEGCRDPNTSAYLYNRQIKSNQRSYQSNV